MGIRNPFRLRSDPERVGLELEPHLNQLYRLAYRLTQNEPDARELVQDTCVRALLAAEEWDSLKSPLAWLARVQYNLFIDATRRRRKRELHSSADQAENAESVSDPTSDPLVCAEHAQRITQLFQAWNRLNDDQRLILSLRAEGFTLAEMQEITGFGADVLNARLHRARKSLARYLEQVEAALAPHAMEN